MGWTARQAKLQILCRRPVIYLRCSSARLPFDFCSCLPCLPASASAAVVALFLLFELLITLPLLSTAALQLLYNCSTTPTRPRTRQDATRRVSTCFRFSSRRRQRPRFRRTCSTCCCVAYTKGKLPSCIRPFISSLSSKRKPSGAATTALACVLACLLTCLGVHTSFTRRPSVDAFYSTIPSDTFPMDQILRRSLRTFRGDIQLAHSASSSKCIRQPAVCSSSTQVRHQPSACSAAPVQTHIRTSGIRRMFVPIIYIYMSTQLTISYPVSRISYLISRISSASVSLFQTAAHTWIRTIEFQSLTTFLRSPSLTYHPHRISTTFLTQDPSSRAPSTKAPTHTIHLSTTSHAPRPIPQSCDNCIWMEIYCSQPLSPKMTPQQYGPLKCMSLQVASPLVGSVSPTPSTLTQSASPIRLPPPLSRSQSPRSSSSTSTLHRTRWD